MELRHLRYFVAVAEELNFTKAAQRMCTVQPSLSQQIKDLEQEVGVQLLVRTNRKVELTEEGLAFLKEAQLCLEHAKKAIDDARKVFQFNQDHLNIGFIPVAEMKVFPYIMPNIRAHFPSLTINFQSLTDELQFQALKKGEIDIAFTRFVNDSEEFESLQVFQEPLVLIVPQDSSFSAAKKVSLKNFNQQNFVISDEGSSPQLHNIIKKFFKKNKLNPNIVQYSTNILLNINLVGMGLGWSLVPMYVTPLIGDKVVVKNTVEPLPMISLYASYRKSQKNEAIELILKILKEHFYIDIL
jgi:LysR family transcriptional regulator, hca operon transcriptional activator